MKKVIYIILSLAVFVIAVYGLYYAITPVNSKKVEYVHYENSISTNAFVIHDEWVATSRSDATAYFGVTEGDRVAKDSIVGELFYGEVSEESMKELSVVDNKIRTTKAQKSNETGIEIDETNIENSIYSRENDIIEAAAKNDIAAISRSKRDIISLRKNKSLSYEDEIKALESQRQAVIGKTGLMKEDVVAQISGVFTTYVDGYEESLKVSDIDSYDVSYFNNLSQSPKTVKLTGKVSAGGQVCKIVNNHVFYVLMSIPTDVMEGHEVGDSVKIRFDKMASAMAKGSIYKIGEDDNGKRLVTVACREYLEGAFSYRSVDVDLIFESYDGYKVPVHALRTDDDGKHKVIGIKDGKRFDCYVNVLYNNTDGDYTIVTPTDDSKSKLSQMDRIQVGER